MSHVPFIAQLSASDCGAACLAMAMSYHGRRTSLSEVLGKLPLGRDGASALALKDAAEQFGFRARGIFAELDAVDELAPGAILHWRFCHFVVLARVTNTGATIVDPASGQRDISREEFSSCFTGVALEVEISEETVPEVPRARSIVLRRAARFIARSAYSIPIVGLSFVGLIAAAILPAFTAVLVDRVVPYGDSKVLVVISAAAAYLVICHAAVLWLRGHLLVRLRTLVDAQLWRTFVEHLVSLPYGYFQSRPVGDILTRLNSNTTVRDTLSGAALSVIVDGILASTYLVATAFISWRLTMITIAFAGLQCVVVAASARRSVALNRATVETYSALNTQQYNLFNGIDTVKSMGLEDDRAERLLGSYVGTLNAALERGEFNATTEALLTAIRQAAPLALLGAGALEVLDGHTSLGAMLSACALAGAFLAPLSSILSSINQLLLLRVHLDRIDEVYLSAAEQSGESNLANHTPLGHIQLDGVVFSYGPREKPVVNGARFEILPNEFVAVVGRSGCGKSTLLKLLLGLYPANSGHIAYDGVPLERLNLRRLRSLIGYVPQATQLFSDTIRANIAVGMPSAPLEDVERAARQAGIHDDIAAMPLGYDTILADLGGGLSGGQRQRLALARALLRKPKIVLLDEATSSLDVHTEQLIHDRLAAVKATRIVVSHRLPTIVNADKIVMIEDGAVVAVGPHEQLTRTSAKYRELVGLDEPSPSEGVAPLRSG